MQETFFMKYKLSHQISLLTLVFLGGCASLQGNQVDIARLQNKVTVLEQRTAGLEKNTGVGEILRRQAEQGAELDSTRIDIQSINGRVADYEETLEQLREQISMRQSDLEIRVAQLEDQLQQLSASRAPQQSSPELIPTVPSVNDSPALLDDSAKTVNSSEDANNRGESSSAEDLYREALQLVQENMEFRAAREKFTTFVDKYPQHELAINAMYWIGETLYGNKKYENAILQFQDVIQMYPDHSKVPAALLKQGLAFYNLGDQRNAEIILQKVVDKYPDSPEAKKAQERLEKW
jgi:tol-pal system protein YbgF